MTNEYTLYIKQVVCDDYVTCILNAVSDNTTDTVISSVQDNYSQSDCKEQLRKVLRALRYEHNATACSVVEL